jgi:hypothetical protein
MKSGRNLLVVLAVAGLAGTALADQVHISHPGDEYRHPNFAGGAFRASHVSGYIGEYGGFGGSADSFLTFCLEKDEFVNMGSTYYVTLDTVARDGGAGGPSPDPISAQTAAMYQEFRNGGSFGGLGALDTANEIRSLQMAIWFSEDEISNAEFNNDALAVALYNWGAQNNNGTIGNVRVMNLWTSANGGHAQDMLTIVPLPTAAWAGMASMAGVAGLGYVRRRGHRA